MSSPAPTAEQPSSDQQQAESVDLTPVEAAFAAALAALLLRWVAIKARWITDLVDQVRDAAGKDDGGRAFTTISVDTAETDHATEVVHDALVAYAEKAAQHVVHEAALQGETIDPAKVDSDALEDAAAVAVALLADALELSAASEAARVHPPAAVIEQQAEEAATKEAGAKPSKQAVKKAVEEAREEAAKATASKVEEHLHELTDAQLRYVLGGALSGAQNLARIATLAGAGNVAVFSSEVLDGHTCLPCQEIHGRRLKGFDSADWSQVFAAYPVRGYINCLGRDRCRGTVVGLWQKSNGS